MPIGTQIPELGTDRELSVVQRIVVSLGKDTDYVAKVEREIRGEFRERYYRGVGGKEIVEITPMGPPTSLTPNQARDRIGQHPVEDIMLTKVPYLDAQERRLVKNRSQPYMPTTRRSPKTETEPQSSILGM